ncbi:MAG: hypothetical protein WC785_09760 [Tatlockia sp.]|jgi:phosphoglycerol transferase
MLQKDLSSRNPFYNLARAEWKWLLAGALFSFYFASFLIVGWKQMLFPDLHNPYSYGGDGKFIIWQIQRVMESWIFDGSRSGYPFGSHFADYPNSDSGNLLVLKGLGLLTGSFSGALNLYLLLGFPLTFIASFLVLRTFALKPAYAFATAILFAFAPFHLYRMYSHVYYSWYFVVPLYFYYGWKILNTEALKPFSCFSQFLKTAIILIIASSFGVYYAVFGIVTFAAAGLAAVIKHRKAGALLLAGVLSALVATGVGLNLVPSMLHQHQQGKNPEATKRYMVETEIYGLKLSNLLFPPVNHRISKFGALGRAYAENFSLNETLSSSLGLIASLGFILLLFSLVAAALGRKIAPQPAFLAVLVLAFVLIATVGGLNVFFTLLVSPSIRGWNRISIFISFASLAAFFLFVQNSKKIKALCFEYRALSLLIPLLITGIGLFDQSSGVSAGVPPLAKAGYQNESRFVHAIEAILPPHAAIYQLPYMKFPESPPVVHLGDYELLGGYINSTTLRWSHGGIKGREGDLFYRYLAQEPLAKQLEIIQRLGFSGIYIDKRGYADHGKEVVEQLEQLLQHQHTLVRDDHEVLFYQLPPAQHADFSGLSPLQIMQKAGFVVSKEGPVAIATVP